MRILEVNSSAAALGGAQVYLHGLIDGLRQRGHQVGLFAGSSREEVREPERRLVKRPALDAASLFHEPEVVAALRDFSGAFRPDLIHVHELRGLPVSAVAELGRTGVPVVHSLKGLALFCPNSWCTLPDGTLCGGGAGAKCFAHGCESNYPYDARTVLATRLRCELARGSFDAFVTGSRFLADTCRAHGFEGVHLVPEYADDGLGPEARGAVDAAEREPCTVLFVGRLSAEKGVAHLVEAMAVVRRQLPEARLAVLGDGDEREHLERRVSALELGEAVTFLGRVPHEEVQRWQARATVQVLPSISCESATRPCYECMLAGIPLIASRIGALPEVVRDGVTGLLFRPRDAQDLAEKILRALLDPALRARLGANARRESPTHPRELHLDRIERVFEGLVARAGREPGPRTEAPLSLPQEDLVRPLHGLLQELRGLETRVAEAHAQATRSQEHTEELRRQVALLGAHLADERARSDTLEADGRALAVHARQLEEHVARMKAYIAVLETLRGGRVRQRLNRSLDAVFRLFR